MYNNIARYNLIKTKYRKMALPSFGTRGQKKVGGDHQRETTHEICCLATEL